MKHKKTVVSGALALALLLTTLGSAPATAYANQSNDYRNEADNQIATQIVRSEKKGKFEVSNDGGLTYKPLSDGVTHWETGEEGEWEEVTIEMLEEKIKSYKEEMQDEEFMKMMLELNDFTKEDMENLIKNCEKQIEQIKSGVVIKHIVFENGDSMVGSYDVDDFKENIHQREQGYQVIYTNEKTGTDQGFSAESIEDLTDKLDVLLDNGEITQPDYDKIMLDIQNQKDSQSSAIWSAVPIEDGTIVPKYESNFAEDRMKMYEEFDITFEPLDNYFGNVYYKGELVKSFSDLNPNGGALMCQSIKEGGKLQLKTVYDSQGNLIGVEEV